MAMDRVNKKDHKSAGGRERSAEGPLLRVQRRKEAFSVFGGAVETETSKSLVGARNPRIRSVVCFQS